MKMEDKMSDQIRGMAPSEMMQKICAIDPMGLLGDSGKIGEHGNPDQEMQETHSRGSEEMEEADDNPDIHKNIHVVSASEGEGSEGERRDEPAAADSTASAASASSAGPASAASDGPARARPFCSKMATATANAGGCISKEKGFIIVDIEKKINESENISHASRAGMAALPGKAGPVSKFIHTAEDSSSRLMPPPKLIPAATTPVPVPVLDPKQVKEIYQQRVVNPSTLEKPASRVNVENEGSKTRIENIQETFGYSAESGLKNFENVLPKIKPVPAEADLIPPKTYKAIVANKKDKDKVGTIGGITSGQDPIECGSFYNSSDNRVARSVYKEDLVSMSVTSLSFNPKSWMCTACPKSHSVVEGGGAGGGG
jgi:hypothetical protein